MYETHRIRIVSTLIESEINIYYAARFILRCIFSTRLFFKPAYADRRDSEVTRAVQIDRCRHIDT